MPKIVKDRDPLHLLTGERQDEVGTVAVSGRHGYEGFSRPWVRLIVTNLVMKDAAASRRVVSEPTATELGWFERARLVRLLAMVERA